jgi:hypothetical protein
MTVNMGRPASLDAFDIATPKEVSRQVIRLSDIDGRPDIVEFLCKDIVSGNGLELAADRIRAVDISITRFSRPPDLRDWHGAPLNVSAAPKTGTAQYTSTQQFAHPSTFALILNQRDPFLYDFVLVLKFFHEQRLQ